MANEGNQKPLSDKEKAFCKEYIIDLNQTQAAIRAGYSERSARQTAARLMTKDNVELEIQGLMGERSKRTEITADFVLGTIVETIDRCKVGNPVLDNFGKQVLHIKEDGTVSYAYRPEHANVLKGCELLGKHLKLFTEKVEVTDIGKASKDEQIARLRVIAYNEGITFEELCEKEGIAND